MTDKELLELAAKAAGIDPQLIAGKSVLTPSGWSVDYIETWNPLEDDGDALRLAVKLDIVPRAINGVAFAWRDCTCDVQEPYEKDPYAATRRAIVRAAAEIGKGMK